MMKDKTHDDEMLAEYDFSGGQLGKYAKDYTKGTNVILLSPLEESYIRMAADEARERGALEWSEMTIGDNDCQ